MVNVTQEQADLIEKVVSRYGGDKTKAALNFVQSKGLTSEVFVRCMIEGYTIVRTKEDRLKELYYSYHRQGVARTVIKKVLLAIEMKVEGITDEE